MIQITAVYMVGSEHHQHIAQLRWRDTSDNSTGAKSREDMVTFVRQNPVVAGVNDAQGWVPLRVVEANSPYVQTYADGRWTDNLLALPRY
jgi:hypothetical protein